MANPEHFAILRQGVERWNDWRAEHSDVVPDLAAGNLAGMNLRDASLETAILHDTDLSGACLIESDLGGADLRGAVLREANLSGAYVRLANLREASLENAKLHETRLDGTSLRSASLRGADARASNLSGADLTRGDLRDVDLCDANLRFANLTEAEIHGANLKGLLVGFTVFGANDLSSAIGLDMVRHWGPSSVGIDTIYKSRGKIPEVFLRGCGVPDEFIAYVGSMVGRPIEFYSCFISYSSKDQEFADRLYADLQNKGVRCWFAPHDIRGGRKVHEQIDDAIRLHDKLLLILSEHSMKSNWVKTEIAKARKREEDENRVKDPLNRKERLNGARIIKGRPFLGWYGCCGKQEPPPKKGTP